MWRERCPPIPFHSPLCSSCTPPHLHALHPLRTHAGRRADRAPPHPFPFASRPLCPGCSPFPLAYALPAVRTPSHFACMLGRHKGQCPPLLFAGRPLHLGCTSPPSIWVPHHPCMPFCVHAGSAGRTGVRARGGPRRGCHVQGGPRVRGGLNRRGPCVRDGGTERWAVQPRQQMVEVRRACKQGEVQPG